MVLNNWNRYPLANFTGNQLEIWGRKTTTLQILRKTLTNARYHTIKMIRLITLQYLLSRYRLPLWQCSDKARQFELVSKDASVPAFFFKEKFHTTVPLNQGCCFLWSMAASGIF
ncbi:uncharacterized protein LOC132609630 [Lycium barbarum]|uniref:uncharacterized protein LOC132609630 n=1 Tax=Lycium barbarum TaxID=112863 RepID=UPI00293EB864|nr:uncharacterized protein LOC132609630 [Lycium barbarum]